MNLANNKLMKEVTKHGGELVRYLSKNSPTILTGCAVAGAVTAVVLAVKATKPALQHIKEAKVEHRDRIIIPNGDEREDFELTEEEIEAVQLKPTEVVQACWKDYVPTAIVLAGTTACIIGAHSISAKRTAAMAALYTMSEQSLKDWKEKTKQIAGEGKTTQIKDAVAEQSLSRHPFDESLIEGQSGPGMVRCYDQMSGRYFWSNADKIRTAVAELKAQCFGGERVTVNDFYYHINIDGVRFGEDMGWTPENLLEIEFTSSLMSDGTPVLAIAPKTAPMSWYY